MKHEKYNITGMSCAACASRIEKCTSKLDGMQKVNVNLLTNSMQVDYDDEKLSGSVIVKTVADAGYGAYPANAQGIKGNPPAAIGTVDEETEMKHRLIGSIVFLLPIMYISMCHMLSKWLGIPTPGWFLHIFSGPGNALTFSFSQFLLILPILYLNRKYFQNGLRSLLHGAPNMDSLVAIGSGASILFGIFAVFRIGWGMGHGTWNVVATYSNALYFESAGMILTLITVGKFLESKSKRKTSEAIEKLMNLTPKYASVLRNDQEMIIPVEDVSVGDVVIVRPGKSIPVDGIITFGSTVIDESAVTGESIPVEKQVGDKVTSATINKSGLIHFTAQRVGTDTTINQIIRLVDEASSSKAPIAKLADKIAGVFVPAVIIIAVMAIAVWLFLGASVEFAFSIGIAVLVISCPCALGLATPVAIMVGVGKGAENGILIKSGEALETAHVIDTVVMDKTGTITEGRPRVTDVHSFHVTDTELLGIASGLEKGSEHPLADAVMTYSHGKKIIPYIMKDFKIIPGHGIQATYNNTTYYAGNAAFMTKCNIDVSAVLSLLNQLADEGKTPLIFSDNNSVIGILAVADTEKPSSAEAIASFKKMGLRTIMLTGDNHRTAEAFRKRLQIPQVVADILPMDKEKYIKNFQNQGHRVAMVGDGINDAPALAAADVGIAIGAGTDIAIDSADVVLMRNDLLDVVSTIRLSRAVVKNIKENLFWAFFYNIIGIPIAAGALYSTFGITLNPMICAVAMSMSSVCVVLNALRLRFFRINHTSNNVSRETLPEADINIEQKEGVSNMKTTLTIEGMMCAHCQKHVQEALLTIPGVIDAVVDLKSKTAEISCTRQISVSEFENVITDAGYELVK